jgi:hypothetical protein
MAWHGMHAGSSSTLETTSIQSLTPDSRRAPQTHPFKRCFSLFFFPFISLSDGSTSSRSSPFLLLFPLPQNQDTPHEDVPFSIPGGDQSLVLVSSHKHSSDIIKPVTRDRIASDDLKMKSPELLTRSPEEAAAGPAVNPGLTSFKIERSPHHDNCSTGEGESSWLSFWEGEYVHIYLTELAGS